MALSPASSHGGSGIAAGSYLPAGAQTGVTLDTTTYDDGITGVGKVATLITAVENVVLAAAILGDAFPRLALSSDPADYGLMLGDGTASVFGATAAALTITPTQLVLTPGSGRSELYIGGNKPLSAGAPTAPNHAALVSTVSPYLTVLSGALSTAQLVSATARQFGGAAGGDAETITPVATDGTANAATCLVQLSPDDVTYSTLVTVTASAAVNTVGSITIPVNVRVPSGWYLKLTVSHATLGVTTYY